MTDLGRDASEITAATIQQILLDAGCLVRTTEPYEKQRLVMCYVCQGWLMKGTLGPKGCPHCGGAL